MCNYINADGDCLLEYVECLRDTSESCDIAIDYQIKRVINNKFAMEYKSDWTRKQKMTCHKNYCKFNVLKICTKEYITLNEDGKCSEEPPLNLMAWHKIIPSPLKPMQRERRLTYH